MLEIVGKGFANAKAALTGKQKLTEANIDEAVRQIRVSLLEADVELGVVRTFLDRVKKRAVGEVVHVDVKKGKAKMRASPGEHFTLICHNELENLLGPIDEAPITFRRPYTTLMMVGLQGTGKTTTCGKLAAHLLADKRKPMLVAADVYRPAAIDQLKVLGQELGVPVYAEDGLDPVQLCQDALREAKKRKRDVVIFDTAGRLAIDDEMMNELEEIKERTKPDEIFLVADAMAGQDTVNTASEFNRRLDISGFVLTKIDGDARGGAALSIKEITGKPIKFLGVGEQLDKLEPFRPEGLASRILGMGDIVGLMKDFEAVVDEKEAERDTKKLLRGEFTLDDFMKQLKMLQQVGSVSEIFEKFPIFGEAGMPDGAQIDDNAFVVMGSLIQSMTPAERREPQIIDESRAKRIATGSGRKPEQVTDLVARFGMMHQVMAGLAAQPGLLGQLPGFKQLSQIRQLKGMGMSDVVGDAGDPIRAMARGNPHVGLPGMPVAPQQLPDGRIAVPAGAVPPGMSAEEYAAYWQQQQAAQAAAGRSKPQSAKQKKKAKDKRRAARKARRKGRRR
jgi:signal recognition particle subunit SRP54